MIPIPQTNRTKVTLSELPSSAANEMFLGSVKEMIATKLYYHFPN